MSVVSAPSQVRTPSVSANPGSDVRSGSKLSAYVELGKVRLASMAVFAVVIGALAGNPLTPPFGVLVALGVGSMLVAVGGHALNMLMEQHVDARMVRTRSRPLPSGRLSAAEVRVFGFAAAGLGVAVLAASVHPLGTVLCAAIFVTYVYVYTPLKRISSINTLVGAIPGALPPVVGYAAMHGVVDARALTLFAILFCWQIPHFLAISWRYRDDYRAGGMRMLSVEDEDGYRVGRQMVVYCAVLVAVSTLPAYFGMAGEVYLISSMWLGVMFFVPTLVAALLRTEASMRYAFSASLLYLPLLFAMLIADGDAASF